jgi:preprotein translocase subunit SecB
MQQVKYAIKSVRQVEYFIDESKTLENEVVFNLNSTIELVVPKNEVRFTISVVYQTKGMLEDLLRGRVTSVFSIENMKERASYVDGKELVDLPDDLLVTLFSISFSHARALIASSVAGTQFNDLILPLIDPAVEFKKIFGKELKKNNP